MTRIIISEASIELLPLCLHLQPVNPRPSHRQLHGLQLALTLLSLSSNFPKDDAHEGGPSTHSYSHPGIGAAINIASRIPRVSRVSRFHSEFPPQWPPDNQTGDLFTKIGLGTSLAR
jgi:hypothetical protein